MKLADVVACSAAVKATRSRKKKNAALSALLRELRGEDILIAVAFLAGTMRQGRIGLGYATVFKTEAEPALEPTLTLAEVDGTFTEVQTASGPGSHQARRDLLGRLLGRATADEQGFLRRLIVGELRQGALEGILVEAVATAADIEASVVRRACMLCGQLPEVARVALEEGAGAVAQFDLELGRPVSPMLAQTSEGPEEALAQLGRAVFDVKLDGARIQVHKRGADVIIFTRGMKEVTAAVPEVVDLAARLPVDQVVLDGEVLALRDDGRPYPFQTTMRRFGRKQNEARLREQYPLSPFVFDVLHHDGQTVIDEPLEARIDRLASFVPEAAQIGRVVTSDEEEASAFFDEILRQGHEGAMAKAPSSTYAAGSRGAEWLKIKPSHRLDLVVIAAEWGSGRRQGWLSNLHLAAYQPEDGSFVMLGKTFKGMTDAMLAWQTEYLSGIRLGEEGYVVHVEPKLVVEVAISDVQASRHYPGGLALRFARVKRYREDKRPAEADTIQAVREIHEGSTKKRRRGS